MPNLADDYYAYKFINLLPKPWTDWDAYKLGIIDANGNFLKKPITEKEKDSWTLFDKLVANIKRSLEKLPGGKSQIASYATALYLLKD